MTIYSRPGVMTIGFIHGKVSECHDIQAEIKAYTYVK